MHPTALLIEGINEWERTTKEVARVAALQWNLYIAALQVMMGHHAQYRPPRT